MSIYVAPMDIGGASVLVETISVAGSEPTGAGPASKVINAFDQTREVVLAVAKESVEIVGGLAEKARPKKFEVEFGISFTAKGNIIVAGASADASLKIKLTYES